MTENAKAVSSLQQLEGLFFEDVAAFNDNGAARLAPTLLDLAIRAKDFPNGTASAYLTKAKKAADLLQRFPLLDAYRSKRDDKLDLHQTKVILWKAQIEAVTHFSWNYDDACRLVRALLAASTQTEEEVRALKETLRLGLECASDQTAHWVAYALRGTFARRKGESLRGRFSENEEVVRALLGVIRRKASLAEIWELIRPLDI